MDILFAIAACCTIGSFFIDVFVLWKGRVSVKRKKSR